MTQIQDFQELTLKLPAGTVNKVKALVLLSGRPIDEVEDALSAHVAKILDEVIKGELADCLGLSTQVAVINGGVHIEDRVNEAADPTHDVEHGLSGDDDTGEDVSPTVEVEGVVVPAGVKAPEPAKETDDGLEGPFQIRTPIPDAGEDAEAFLEVVPVPAPAVRDQSGRDLFYGGERASKASNTFAGKPRVSIQEYSGAE
jgi:hypothetical protein